MKSSIDGRELARSASLLKRKPTARGQRDLLVDSIAERDNAIPWTRDVGQSPGRLQADTSMGRLMIEDLPERNLLLEAYQAKSGQKLGWRRLEIAVSQVLDARVSPVQTRLLRTYIDQADALCIDRSRRSDLDSGRGGRSPTWT